MKTSFLLIAGVCLWLVGFPQGLRADVVACFCALDADIDALKKAADRPAVVMRVGGSSVLRMTFGPHTVLAVKMGSGAVQTAMSAEALLGRQKVDLALSTGPVGGITDRAMVGKWYRVERVIAWQSGSHGSTGFARGEQAEKNLEAATATKAPVPKGWENVEALSVASGEVFVASNAFRSQLAAESGCDAVDMNLFGLLTVCEAHQVPLAAWRVVSDRADDEAGAVFRAFSAEYDGAGGTMLAEWIRGLPIGKQHPEAYPALKEALEGR